MRDLIYRQAALSLAKDICVPIKDGTVYKYRCIDPDEIRELPSAQPEQRWVPCSERLPEVDEEVLVYLWDDVPHLAWIDKDGQWETDHFYLDESDLPKAWMPLPKPYQE